MLLFLDQQQDLHADWVEAECERRAVPYLRFCTETFPQATRLSVEVAEGKVGGQLRLPQQEVALASITGVWYRRPGEITLDPALDEAYLQFARMESEEMLYGLYRVLWDRRWVNQPHLMGAANHKLGQLRLAHWVGLQTVPTLVTNDPAEALAFFHAQGGAMVYKTMRQVAITHDGGSAHGIYTTLITRENLEPHLESIRYIPCLFQQVIPKQLELRINVIGEHVWTTAIYTQEAAHTQLDWRPYTDEVRHAPFLLPPALEAKCLELNRRLGLRMSNIDMIVTPEGEFIFLEVNPNGQWAWVEDKVGFPLAAALVDELLGVDTLAEHPYRKDRSLHFEPDTAIKQQTAQQTVRRAYAPVA